MLRLKKEIYQHAFQRQESVINDYKRRIQDAMANDGTVNEEQYDNQKQGFEAQILSEVTLLNEQLVAAEKDLEELKKTQTLGTLNSGKAGFGKVVKTNKRTFFIAIGIEDFDVNGEMISGISVHSPAFKAMEGKKSGDRFIVNGTIYHILDVY
ncbi:MAG TPA: hypothetical protein VG737_05345 [Cyclobacteriaceae bacterium]|nr:hypothetical protein [Cyclobacteriaceae bacterium]